MTKEEVVSISNNVPIVPPVPGLSDDVADAAVVEQDGEKRLDPDVNPELVDSAEADRLAAEAADTDEDADE